MNSWERFKSNRESQFEKIREKMKEYQLEYWTEKLDYVRACFGYKPTTEGKTRRHSIGMSRKDVLNKKKTSEPVAKKRD